MTTSSRAVRASREMPTAIAVCVAAPRLLKAMLPKAYRGSLLTSEPIAGPGLLGRCQAGKYDEDPWVHEAHREEGEEGEEEEVDELMAS